jgi:hypothetical protein
LRLCSFGHGLSTISRKKVTAKRLRNRQPIFAQRLGNVKQGAFPNVPHHTQLTPSKPLLRPPV